MTQRPAHDEVKMSLGDHLEELRRRILIGLIGLVIAGIGMIFFADRVVGLICQPLLYELAREGKAPSLIMRTVGSAFNVYLQVCVLGGLVIGIPWILWQLWKFISPGLHPHERRFVTLLMPGSAVLAAMGVLFMYYMMLPLAIWFFLGFTDAFSMPSLAPTAVQKYLIGEEEGTKGQKDQGTKGEETAAMLKVPVMKTDPAKPIEGQVWINSRESTMKMAVDGQVMTLRAAQTKMIEPLIELDEYVSFVLWMAVSFAVVFQLPLLMLLAGWAGIVERRAMAKGRKIAMLLAFIVGAVITPGGSPVAQVATALPMYLLYELGLLLMWLFVKRKTTLWSQWDDAGAE
ncbi:MAG: twin-arginine translocase subunit TatC [Phycisphaerales bacterium]